MFVNIPVLLLYRACPWHVLPNLAALFAVLHLRVSIAPDTTGRGKPLRCWRLCTPG